MFVKKVGGLAEFSPTKMAKITVARGDFVFAGLNCFEPGQQHEPHTHDDQDKLYLVLKGSGEVQVGGMREILSAGDLAIAPAGILHAIRNPGPARLVVMTVLAPPPRK